jgi:hypothetical protein
MRVDSRKKYDWKGVDPRIESSQVDYEGELRDRMCMMTQKLCKCIGIIFQQERCFLVEYQGPGQSGDFAGAEIKKYMSFAENGVYLETHVYPTTPAYTQVQENEKSLSIKKS